MAISVKDIQEKEFTAVSENGYSMEQVDDFLDELAEQWSVMLRDNLSLSEQVKQLQTSLDEAKSANAEMQKRLPDYNEQAYFKNLENAIRESLIGAQRIADETVSEAKREAKQTTDDANATAEKTVADANAKAESISETAKQTIADLTAEADRLRSTIDDYKTKLRALIDEHLASLTNK